MLGIAFFCGFLLLGVMTLRRVRLFGPQTRAWLGMALGLMEMMWFPSLFAFFIDFTPAAQWYALLAGGALCGAGQLLPAPREALTKAHSEPPALLTLSLVVPFLLLSTYLQYTHTLLNVDGALYVGQSTYGDLCLHLGIATGLQGAAYPPEYTLLPGVMLGYPFLFDALSASMLALGTSLTGAFIVPGAVTMGLVFWGFVMLAWEMTRDKRAVALSFVLVFLNGGLGFLYLLDGLATDATRLYEALFGYYHAPTNMPDFNLRWSNVICDLMIPQRTLLAGWAAVLPALYALCRALSTGRRAWFVALGVWAGLMPMVHTHSFLALGLISAGCMALCVIRAQDRWALGKNFLLYGAIALALALPQLLLWTFPQTIGGGSLAFRWNWVNTRSDGTMIDGYLWFYLKNVGPVYLLMIPAALNMPKRLRPLALGALCVYVMAELIQFQPNEYDNNKLFYVAFLLMMPMVGRLLSSIWARLQGLRGRVVLGASFMVVCLLSGGLTVAREAISSYELFDAAEVRAAEFVSESAPKDAVFLTGRQHDNAIAALTGRKLVCGTQTYLFFHGVDYARQAEDARAMFEQPEANLRLFDHYGVDYVYVSSHEKGAFAVDERALRSLFPVCYEDAGIIIFSVAG